MYTYKVKLQHKRLANTTTVDETSLVSQCEKVNRESYGKYSTYSVYRYDNGELVALYEVRVVNPDRFALVSLPNLMREVKI